MRVEPEQSSTQVPMLVQADFVLIVAAAVITLVAGDFASTFFYHVPQHCGSRCTCAPTTTGAARTGITPCSRLDPAVLLDGFLGAVPYVVVAALRLAAVVGGSAARVWRWVSCTSGGATPPISGGGRRGWLRPFLRPLGIVLPEDHDGHHRNPDIEFGDIFRFYDAPARALMARLAPTSRRARNAAGRRTSGRAAEPGIEPERESE